MSHFIDADDCLEAWKEGCKLILKDNSEKYNVITEIKNPSFIQEDWFTDYNPNPAKSHSKPSISDVVNTIFPYKLHARQDSMDRAGFYDKYLRLHQSRVRLSGRKRTQWGTYFERMINFGKKPTNQLEDIIQVLSGTTQWLRVTNPIHISSADYDSLKKKMGNPCLQYVQFIQEDEGILSLIAVYRNHDYFNKALGNFIGLGQLLNFVAMHTNKRVGSLNCHSVHLFHESSKSELRRLAKLEESR